MMHALWQLFVLICCVIGLSAAYSLARRLLRTTVQFFNELLDMAVALFFWVLIVPPLWLWEKARRPMWRTLTREQTRDLEGWLRRGSGG